MTLTWPIDREALPDLPQLTAPPSAEYLKALAERNSAESVATAVMFWLSGRQFGLEEVTARPCRAPLRSHQINGPVTSYVVSWEGDHWINLTCGCAGGCRKAGPNVVHLPGPVYTVTEVKLADAVLAPNVWTVEGNLLYRRDAPWPRQDLNRPAGDVGTWTVKYQRGIPVPAGVDQLTGELAAEILKGISGDGACRLPRTVTTASRNGVTYRVYDPAVIYANGKTGIPVIDLWLAGVNPNHLTAAPSVI